MRPTWLVLIAIGLAAFGQLTMKSAMTGGPATDLMSPVQTVLNILKRPLVYLGLSFYGISAFFWLVSLNKLPLSYMYPFTAFLIVIVTLSSALLFNEGLAQWSAWRVSGLVFICVGLVLMARS